MSSRNGHPRRGKVCSRNKSGLGESEWVSGREGVVLSCDGSEGVLTWCFLCFVCFNPEDNHCVESQFRLFSCFVFCFSLAEFSLREDWRTV